MDRVREAVERDDSAWCGVPNFSVGVNVFSRWWRRRRGCWRTKRNTARGRGRFIIRTKKDAPSGTLLKLVEDDEAGRATTRTIDAASNRAGTHPGTHEIGFDSAADTITLRHTARSREGFARGRAEGGAMGGGARKDCYEFSEVLFGVGEIGTCLQDAGPRW